MPNASPKTQRLPSARPLELSGMGRVNFAKPQQQWQGDGVMRVACFAGQEMIALTTDQEGEGFRLSYLGFKWVGFATMDQATGAAPTFAKRVLQELSNRVKE